MTTLTILIGISGSGKSRYARELAQEQDAVIVSPDELRRWYLGDINDQRQNWQIHLYADALVALHVNHGNNVILDATNCNWKLLAERVTRLDRMTTDTIHAHVRLIERPFLDCAQAIVQDIRDGKDRADVPLHALVRQWEQLQELKRVIDGPPFHPMTIRDWRKDHETTHSKR